MKRHYFISDDLDDLERIEQELEHEGFNKPQIHVLSKDDSAVARHRPLHNIEAVFKQDVVNGTLLGAMFGVLAATLVLMFGYMTNMTETYSWTPFYFSRSLYSASSPGAVDFMAFRHHIKISADFKMT